MRRVRLLDLHSEYKLFADEIRTAIEAVLESQQFIGGPAVAQLEEALAVRTGVKHAIAVSSGTDALLCTMMAMGITHGDEVILPSFTFFATGGSVARLGAAPVFVDIDPRTFNMDPAAVESSITDRTRVIIAVHLFGQCAEMDAISALAARRGIRVIEDMAQAIGATYRGRSAGTLGDAACLSFYPTKNLGGIGEGGMVLSDDDDLALLVRRLRNHGEKERYVHERVGGNFRLDTIKAAALLIKLRHVDDFTKRRRHNAARYDELLRAGPVCTPYVADHQEAVYHQYSILCERRTDLADFLRGRGVDTGVYYPVPLHLQKCFASLGYRRGALPVTERTCDAILSLPCHPMLDDDDLEYVASCIHEFYATSKVTCAAPDAAERNAGEL